jgi:Tfp pilus assembly protein PilO
MKVLTAITVVAGVGGVGACAYEYSTVAASQAKYQSILKKAGDDKALQSQAAQTAQQLKDCTDRLAHLEKSVPEAEYVPTLLKELENVGNKNGIDVLGVRPIQKEERKDAKNKVSEKKPYDELNIEVKGRGSYMAVLGFVKALRDFPKIVAAKTITLTPKMEKDRTGPPKLDVTVDLKTYVFPPVETAGAPTGQEVTKKNG